MISSSSGSNSNVSLNGNGSVGDLMKIKVAPRYISYRTLFHTIFILAFLLPFVFIPTAFLTLEGVNNCSSFDCLGRRRGPKFLGRNDESGRLVKEFVKILNKVNYEKMPAGVKLPDSFSQLVSEMKTNKFSSKQFGSILKGMMEKYERELRESKFDELMNKHFAASAIPKGIDYLSL